MGSVLCPRVFDDVDDRAPMALPGRFSSTTIVNRAIGGFWSFAARYDADPVALLDLVGLLSKRVDVKDRMGRLAWQGLLTEVEVHEPGDTYSYALDMMANAVNVIFSAFEDDGEIQQGYRDETGWGTTAASITDYGRKEYIKSIAGSDNTDAGNLRDRYLALHDYPLLAQQMNEETIHYPYAWVRGFGYWWTCTWQVYNQTSTGDRGTDEQIDDIISAECPLIASTDLVNTGLSIERARDANQTAWQEILRLIAIGDSSNNPLIGGVWADREFVLETMSTTPDYRRRPDGRYTDEYGASVDPWLLRAGRLLRLSRVVPGASLFSTELDDPRNVFINQVSYSEDRGTAVIVPLGARELADILVGQLEPWR